MSLPFTLTLDTSHCCTLHTRSLLVHIIKKTKFFAVLASILDNFIKFIARLATPAKYATNLEMY